MKKFEYPSLIKNFTSFSVAERRILVRTLPVDVVTCRAGGFVHLKWDISKVFMTFLGTILP